MLHAIRPDFGEIAYWQLMPQADAQFLVIAGHATEVGAGAVQAGTGEAED